MSPTLSLTKTKEKANKKLETVFFCLYCLALERCNNEQIFFTFFYILFSCLLLKLLELFQILIFLKC